ncbi:membrane protein [Blastomonas marina]|uniref:Membrane protein n=1 Tax=Blastomonas marina TaxID=1867408 RepID=A0ABQ1FCM7_9SPHN|nr:TPM domain-containing protein [Blastomonas marina]GGA06852.1 membrane protein [Blastomonas marina]
MKYLNAEDHAKVSEAVAAAELTTSGEIVTVLADRSDGYTDVILVWAAVIAFTAMSIFAVVPDALLDTIDWFRGGWTHDWTFGEVIAWLTGLGVVLFLAIWGLFSWERLTYALIPGPVKTKRVHHRAIEHFKVGAERRTHGRTGVLLYLSMKEHRAEIVADQPIAEIVSAEVWGEAMEDMLVHIREGHIADGLAAGVRDVGKVLSENFPRAEDDQNELPDRLIEV